MTILDFRYDAEAFLNKLNSQKRTRKMGRMEYLTNEHLDGFISQFLKNTSILIMATYHLLPMDLIIEILSWLPVISLMRFKCVCKSWCSLFESPNFISCHLKKTNNKNNNVNFMLVNAGSTYDSDPKYCFLLSSYETLDFTTNLEFPNCEHFGNKDTDIDIVGSCNGVICATYLCRNEFALWNPATREVKFVQISHEEEIKLTEYCHFGFGLDLKTSDYKVVRIRNKPILTEVYSLRTASWRRIEAVFPGVEYIMDCGMPPFINGKVSWLVSTDNEQHAAVLLSFDISDEFFLTTPCPDGFGTRRHMINLMVLNELVAVMVEHNVRADHDYVSAFDLWVLNEYGRKESWVKLYTIGPLSTTFSPLGFWKNGEWFLSTMQSHLVLFNPINLEMTDIQLDDESLEPERLMVVCYKDSLVRLN